MGDFVRTIFGGAKQTSQSQQTSKPVDMQSPELKALRGPFASLLSELIQNRGGPDYTGDLTAPITDNETSLLSELMKQTGSGTPRAELLDKTLSGNFLPGQAGANPFLEATIKAAQRPTLQGLEETLSRTLPGRFTAAGQFIQPQGSSAFDRAAAIATRGAADAIGDIATNISYKGYADERQRQNDAIPLSQAEVATTIQNLQAQALPRLIQENGIERGLALFKQKSDQLLQLLQVISGATAPVIGQESQGTASAEGTSSKGIFSQLFPGGL